MKTLRKKRGDGLTAFLFLLPAGLCLLVFKYWPLFSNFQLSTTSWNLFTDPKNVGLANFKAIFKSETFWKILKNTFQFTIWSTLFSVSMGFIIAVCLQGKKGKGVAVLKTLFFIPNITTASAVALLWKWIFDFDYGLMGQLFGFFGKQSPKWLLDPKLAMWVIISLSVWRSMGYVMLIYNSGLAGISNDVYEAAEIDGASKLQTVFRITLPLLKPTTYFLLTTTFIQSMQVFDIVSVMTNGGPYGSTTVLNLYIYQMAFQQNKAGYASALSVILFFILLVAVVLQRRISRDKEEING